MNLQTALAIIDFLKKYGPTLIQLGGAAAHAVRDLIALIRQFRDHEALSDEQRADLKYLIDSDPTTWGMPQSAPPPPPPMTSPLIDYNVITSQKPDVSKLVDGDVVYELPDGRFYTAIHGIGVAGIPGEGWKQIWPEA